jgi:hypothetical protein
VDDRRKFLEIYLNDHLAGSAFGVELARRLQRNHAGTSFGPALKRIADEIQADRNTLIELMDRMGVRRERLRGAVAIMLERTSRLKPNGSLFRHTPLSSLIDLEALSLGVQGKRALWAALRTSLSGSPGLHAEFDRLTSRAEGQWRALEEMRLEAAAAAFGARARSPVAESHTGFPGAR